MADNMIECEILRDRWDEDGKRHRAGSVIQLEAEAAMDAIESGDVKRVKSSKKKTD